jgi:serine/threonine-protein kinase HipA
MTSEPTRAYVWIWLPGALEPVVCGVLDDDGRRVSFAYARSYLDRRDAVPIFAPELPLTRGPQFAAAGDRLPLCIDDAMPDSWGRQLIGHRLGAPTVGFNELTYLLQSGSDRVGALDFQISPEEHVPRGRAQLTVEELEEAARRIQGGAPVDEALQDALLAGSTLGGARPKALLTDGTRRLIAKFTSTKDQYPVVRGEFVAMTLARRCGLDVAGVALTEAGNREVLIVERFDREPSGARRRVVSALTVLGLDTFPGGRYATYVGLADAIRARFSDPDATLRELFSRISFNMLCGNSDDHGRNHAAFVGEGLTLDLTPAYDITPDAFGSERHQAMAYGRGPDQFSGERTSRTCLLVDAAAEYHLSRVDAQAIVDRQVDTIRRDWEEVCDAAKLTVEQRNAFWETQFLHRSVLA